MGAIDNWKEGAKIIMEGFKSPDIPKKKETKDTKDKTKEPRPPEKEKSIDEMIEGIQKSRKKFSYGMPKE